MSSASTGIECLAHEEGRSSRGVYNKAEYEEQRRHMLQEWADMVDAWVEGRKRTPTLYPPSMQLIGNAATASRAGSSGDRRPAATPA